MANIVSNSMKYFTYDGLTVRDFDLQKEFDQTAGYQTGIMYHNKIDKEINFTTRWSPVQESIINDFFQARNQIIRKLYVRIGGEGYDKDYLFAISSKGLEEKRPVKYCFDKIVISIREPYVQYIDTYLKKNMEINENQIVWKIRGVYECNSKLESSIDFQNFKNYYRHSDSLEQETPFQNLTPLQIMDVLRDFETVYSKIQFYYKGIEFTRFKAPEQFDERDYAFFSSQMYNKWRDQDRLFYVERVYSLNYWTNCVDHGFLNDLKVEIK